VNSQYAQPDFTKETSTNNFLNQGDDSSSNDRFSAMDLKSNRRSLPNQQEEQVSALHSGSDLAISLGYHQSLPSVGGEA
jgi:hypothetical protein